MTVTELLAQAYLLATGKAKAFDTTKKTKLLAIANVMQDQWEAEPDIDWESTYDNVAVVAPIDDTNTAYALPSTIRTISKKEGDRVRVQHLLSGQSSYYDIIQPSQMESYKYAANVAAIKGRSTVIFPQAFSVASAQFGGTIYVPAYLKLADLVTDEQEIMIDDPSWLVYMTAAEYVRNDITKANQYGNLVAYAANSMNEMKQNNGGQLTEIAMFPNSIGETW